MKRRRERWRGSSSSTKSWNRKSGRECCHSGSGYEQQHAGHLGRNWSLIVNRRLQNHGSFKIDMNHPWSRVLMRECCHAGSSYEHHHAGLELLSGLRNNYSLMALSKLRLGCKTEDQGENAAIQVHSMIIIIQEGSRFQDWRMIARQLPFGNLQDPDMKETIEERILLWRPRLWTSWCRRKEALGLMDRCHDSKIFFSRQAPAFSFLKTKKKH